MANANTLTTLDAVHTGIISAIAAKFTALKTVAAYPMDRKALTIPACLIELTEMTAINDEDPGTEQQAVYARFEARLIIGFRQDKDKNPKLEIRKLAAAVGAFVRAKRWGCPIGPAELIGIYQDDFDPELDQYEVWRVEWQQIIHLGESVWTGYDEGDVPQRVYLGIAPEIGPEHIDDYVEITGLLGIPEPPPDVSEIPEGEP